MHSGNTDKTGIQRSSYRLGASDLTTAHSVAASDVRRHMTLQALRPMGRVGQFPAGRKPLEGRGQLSVCVCVLRAKGVGEALLRERGIFSLVFNMAFL